MFYTTVTYFTTDYFINSTLRINATFVYEIIDEYE